jgi:DNA-binding MarR family transcriptional regulator
MRDELQRIAREIEPAFPAHAMRLRALARGLAPLPTLTRKQRKVFDFVRQMYYAESRTPYLREICEHFGYSSLSTASEYIGVLEKKGYVKRHHNVTASIAICAEALYD